MAKTPLWMILNRRARHDREWQNFREEERLDNDRRKRNVADDHGKLRTPGDEPLKARDRGKNQTLDGKLRW